jgi:hypothetical protein
LAYFSIISPDTHVAYSKQLEKPNINIKEARTFHNGEQKKLEDITKITKLEIVRPTKNHPLKLWCIKIEPKTSWELIWDPIENQTFSYCETIVTSPHAKKSKID